MFLSGEDTQVHVSTESLSKYLKEKLKELSRKKKKTPRVGCHCEFFIGFYLFFQKIDYVGQDHGMSCLLNNQYFLKHQEARMKKTQLLILFTTIISSSVAFSQIAFVSPTSLQAEITAAQVVDQISNTDGNNKSYLAYANLQLSLKISDIGCSLQEDSSLLAQVTPGRDLKQSNSIENQINIFLATESVEDAGCAYSSKVIRTENIKVPLINGINERSEKDFDYIYTFNKQAGWGYRPSTLKVTVNQSSGKIVVNILK